MTKIIYCNNAATTWPKPKSVLKAVDRACQLPFFEHGRATDGCAPDYPLLTRKLLGDFFGVKKYENFQFTANATDSLNILIHGYVLQRKRKIHVITSRLEHNSVLRPLYALEKNQKILLTIIPFDQDGKIKLEQIKKSIKSNTELVVFSHGSNVLGSVQDIALIGKYLKKKKIFFIVDAAQTAGYEKIIIDDLHLDALAFTGHKGMFALPGIGGFYIKNPTLVEAYKQGGTGVLSESMYQPEKMPLKFESGTLNYPGIISLYHGIKYIQEIGLNNIRKKNKKMIDFLVSELIAINRVKIFNQKPDLPVVAFNVENISNDDVGYLLLKQFNIISRTGLHCAPLLHREIDNNQGCVRLSLSYFNTMDECKKVIVAIKKIAS